MNRTALIPGGLCTDLECECRGTGVLSIEQLQAEGAQESPPAPLPSEDDELALRAEWGDR